MQSARTLLLQSGWLILLLCGCASPSHLWQPPADFEPAELWQAHWQNDDTAYAQILDQARWENSGSVEAERYRQNWAIHKGQRAIEYQRAAQRALAEPNNPAVQYLYARLYQDPQRLAAEFERLAERWPNFAWIRLGAAGSLMNLGQTHAAKQHLTAAKDWADARSFANAVRSRFAVATGAKEPWRTLMEDAFECANPDALYQIQSLALQHDQSSLAQLCQREISLQRAVGQSEEQRLTALLERGVVELQAQRSDSFEAFLRSMDTWAEQLNLPGQWQTAARYQLPAGLGQLLKPESQATAWSQLLADHHYAIVLGQSFGQSARLLILNGVQRLHIQWPGMDLPLEIHLAKSGSSSDRTAFAGAALFRGFYARRDLSDQLGEQIAVQQNRASELNLDTQIVIQPDRGYLDVGRLPEDVDLPLRLRAQSMQSNTATELQWISLLLHESGHLPDILPWIQQRGDLLEAVHTALYSLLQDSMLLGDWEYRAQLRAMASGHQPRWALAETVETARSPMAPYYRPYRRLLTDLVQVARQENLPALANWHLLSDVELSALARRLLEQKKITQLPAEYVADLIQQVDSLN